jgi:anti-anti-sigma regulatory factor
VLLLVTGDEDRTTSARRRRAISAALGAPRDVCVDLSQLRFADPSLMLDLAVLAQRLRAEGLAVRLRRPQPQIRTLIGLVGLDRQPAVALETPNPRRQQLWLAPSRVHARNRKLANSTRCTRPPAGWRGPAAP